MSLGQVMQAVSAFAIVQNAFGWLVDNYPRLADWNGSARRVAVLMRSLDKLKSEELSEGHNRIKRGQITGQRCFASTICQSLSTMERRWLNGRV